MSLSTGHAYVIRPVEASDVAVLPAVERRAVRPFDNWLTDTGLTRAFLEDVSSTEELEEAVVDEVCRWARSAGYSKVTLSTFREVPWNRPLYEKLGFRVVATALPPEHRQLVARERERGLRTDLRVIMERDLAVEVDRQSEVTRGKADNDMERTR